MALKKKKRAVTKKQRMAQIIKSGGLKAVKVRKRRGG